MEFKHKLAINGKTWSRLTNSPEAPRLMSTDLVLYYSLFFIGPCFFRSQCGHINIFGSVDEETIHRLHILHNVLCVQVRFGGLHVTFWCQSQPSSSFQP